jgi:tetratricopeptide (TPR) repeat protein
MAGIRIQAQSAPEKQSSPAELVIVRAEQAIQKNPQSANSYNQLAMALARRARETSDPSYYNRAELAVQKSFALAPHNLEAEKIHVWLLLGKHEFASARDAATALSHRAPDDVIVQGLLSDANVNLGNYHEAETAAQRMLDLHAGNIPGLTRGAYLRELFGDLPGAMELMNMAYAATPTREVEDRAWILTHLGHLKTLSGDLNGAEASLLDALQLFPNYHYALANLAKVRVAQKRYPEALELLRRRFQSAPHAENLYELAEVLELSGRAEEARAAYKDFEQKALLESPKADNSNHELVLYYLDHASKPTEALRIARMELARRRDVHTLDAYAWALYASGDHAEAKKQIESVLSVGTKDPTILEHARKIVGETEIGVSQRKAPNAR